MSFKILFPLLGALLMLQLCQCSGQDNPEGRFEIFHFLDPQLLQQPRYYLFAWARGEAAILCNFTTFEGRELFGKVARDLAGLRFQNDALRAHLVTFVDFNAEIDQLTPLRSADLAGIKRICESTVHFIKILKIFITPGNTYVSAIEQISPSLEVLLIEQLLEQNGSEHFGELFVDHFLQFLRKFSVKLRDFIGTLKTAEARQENAKLLEWYKDFDETSSFADSLPLIIDGFFSLPENELPE